MTCSNPCMKSCRSWPSNCSISRLAGRLPCFNPPGTANHETDEIHRQQPQQLKHSRHQLLPCSNCGRSVDGCCVLLQQPVHGGLSDLVEQDQAADMAVAAAHVISEWDPTLLTVCVENALLSWASCINTTHTTTQHELLQMYWWCPQGLLLMLRLQNRPVTAAAAACTLAASAASCSRGTAACAEHYS